MLEDTIQDKQGITYQIGYTEYYVWIEFNAL